MFSFRKLYNTVYSTMVDLKQVIAILQNKLQDLEKKLHARRLQMVDQDSANVSRYPTATRWAVEQEIESMDHELVRLKSGIRELEKLSNDPKRYSGKYFVSDEFECLELGIISCKTKLGQEILNKS